MTLTAAAIAVLAEEGLGVEAILRVAQALEAKDGPRSAAAIRQARYRARQNDESITNDVTRDVTRDAEKEAPQTPKEKLQSPHSETTSPHRPKPVRSVSEKAHRLPDDWQPSAEDREYGRKLNLTRTQFEGVLEDMRLWAWSNGGTKTRKLNWSLTFRGFLRRDQHKHAARAGPAAAAPKTTNGYYDHLPGRKHDRHRHDRPNQSPPDEALGGGYRGGPTLDASADAGGRGQVFHIEGFGPERGGEGGSGAEAEFDFGMAAAGGR